ncbi:MAG: orotidine-5'-phosphate decarboxylase [Alphaproteobacteria bacterium]
MSEHAHANPVFVALDTADIRQARAWADAARAHVGGIKLGLEFFVANGGEGVRALAALGLPVFLDLKFHDIPNTVAGAVRAASGLGVAMLNVHAGGGRAMIEAAVAAAGEAGPKRPRVLAVTVLTSLDAGDLAAVGQAGTPPDQVRRLALLAQDSGADGVVCSPAEVAMLRQTCGPNFLLVVPGIRPAGAATGDQKRLADPAGARAAGADVLVIGRPITGAADPAAAAAAIAASLAPAKP